MFHHDVWNCSDIDISSIPGIAQRKAVNRKADPSLIAAKDFIVLNSTHYNERIKPNHDRLMDQYRARYEEMKRNVPSTTAEWPVDSRDAETMLPTTTGSTIPWGTRSCRNINIQPRAPGSTVGPSPVTGDRPIDESTAVVRRDEESKRVLDDFYPNERQVSPPPPLMAAIYHTEVDAGRGDTHPSMGVVSGGDCIAWGTSAKFIGRVKSGLRRGRSSANETPSTTPSTPHDIPSQYSRSPATLHAQSSAVPEEQDERIHNETEVEDSTVSTETSSSECRDSDVEDDEELNVAVPASGMRFEVWGRVGVSTPRASSTLSSNSSLLLHADNLNCDFDMDGFSTPESGRSPAKSSLRSPCPRFSIPRAPSPIARAPPLSPPTPPPIDPNICILGYEVVNTKGCPYRVSRESYRKHDEEPTAAADRYKDAVFMSEWVKQVESIEFDNSRVAAWVGARSGLRRRRQSLPPPLERFSPPQHELPPFPVEGEQGTTDKSEAECKLMVKQGAWDANSILPLPGMKMAVRLVKHSGPRSMVIAPLRDITTLDKAIRKWVSSQGFSLPRPSLPTTDLLLVNHEGWKRGWAVGDVFANAVRVLLRDSAEEISLVPLSSLAVCPDLIAAVPTLCCQAQIVHRVPSDRWKRFVMRKRDSPVQVIRVEERGGTKVVQLSMLKQTPGENLHRLFCSIECGGSCIARKNNKEKENDGETKDDRRKKSSVHHSSVLVDN